MTDGRGHAEAHVLQPGAGARSELRSAAQGFFAGKVTLFNGRRQLTHPDYELVDAPGRRWTSTRSPTS